MRYLFNIGATILLCFTILGDLRAEPSKSKRFEMCGIGERINCVVDGDTLWIDGIKIRIADIDAPETHRPGCNRERKLGSKASQTLLYLVNNTSFTIHNSKPDKDRYGRSLRTLWHSSQSLGGILVARGLARKWTGKSSSWCD